VRGDPYNEGVVDVRDSRSQRTARTTRRELLRLAALGGGLTMLAGPAAAQPFKGVTLNFIGSSGHTQLDPIWARLGEFEASTGAKVVLTRIPLSDLRPKMMQDLRLGSHQFDVFEIPDDTMPSASPFVETLDPLIRKDGATPQAWLGQWVPWTTAVDTYGGQGIKFVTYYSGTVFGAFRANLFNDPKERESFRRQYHYELPAPPQTPQQLVDVARFFTRGENLWGLIFSGKQDPGLNFFEENLFRSGLTHLDEHFNSNWGPKHPENRPVVERIAKFQQDLIYTYKVTPPSMTAMQTSETTDFYLSGKAAMIIDTLYFSWSELNKPQNQARIGRSVAFQSPAWKQGAGGIPFYYGFAIAKGARNVEAAWAFIKWITSPENIKLALTKGRGQFVPTNLALLRWATTNAVLPAPLTAAVSQATFYPLSPANGQVRQIIRKYVELLNGNRITPAQFVEQSGAEVQRFVEQAGIAKG
jgi:multiple sugar transport system substrate-binding protein